jgi:hypothetical protein
MKDGSEVFWAYNLLIFETPGYVALNLKLNNKRKEINNANN